MTLPLNLTYSLRADGQGVHVFAGPYIGLLLGGNYQQHSLDRSGGGYYSSAGDIKPGKTYVVPPVGSTYYPLLCHRFDGGVQAGLGYRYGKLLVQAGFNFGLRDLGPQLSALHNRTAQASLSYLLSSPASKPRFALCTRHLAQAAGMEQYFELLQSTFSSLLLI